MEGPLVRPDDRKHFSGRSDNIHCNSVAIYDLLSWYSIHCWSGLTVAPVSTKVSTSPAPPVKWSALARLLINLSGLFCFSSGTFFIELINNPLSRLGPPGSRLLHFTPCWWRYFSRLHFYCNFMPWCSSFELNFEQLKLPESHLERACRLYVIQRFGKCYNLRSSKSTQVSSEPVWGAV